MADRLMGSILGMALVLAVSPVLFAQTTVDLSGTWATDENIRRFNREEMPSLTPQAAEIFRSNRQGLANLTSAGLDEMDPTIYCLPDGFPRVYLSNYAFEIYQLPDRVLVIYERNHTVRRIYLDGRTMPDGFPPTFTGYSTGRWDGDTLVAETVGLNDLSWLDRLGTPHTDQLRVVEQFRLVAPDTLEVDFLFDDPGAFTEPFEGEGVYQLRTDWEILEHNNSCEDRHRYDYSQKSLLGTTEWTNPEQY